MKFSTFLFHSILLLFCTSCGKEEGLTQEISVNTVTAQGESLLKSFYGTMTKFKTEVFYEEGSEPYTGRTTLGKDYWDIFQRNMKRILQTTERSISVNIPTSLSSMTSFSDKKKSSWSVSEAKELFKEMGASATISDQGVVSIIFVSGYFRDSSGEVKKNVLGIHITGTTQIVIFKDLIKNIEENENQWVALYSEQSVLVHEVGHALGMVNNGLSMVSQHQDEDHGDHCSNDQCVMYWLNEGREGLKTFIQQYITTGNELLFGDQCLQDADKLIQSYR